MCLCHRVISVQMLSKTSVRTRDGTLEAPSGCMQICTDEQVHISVLACVHVRACVRGCVCLSVTLTVGHR